MHATIMVINATLELINTAAIISVSCSYTDTFPTNAFHYYISNSMTIMLAAITLQKNINAHP